MKRLSMLFFLLVCSNCCDNLQTDIDVHAFYYAHTKATEEYGEAATLVDVKKYLTTSQINSLNKYLLNFNNKSDQLAIFRCNDKTYYFLGRDGSIKLKRSE